MILNILSQVFHTIQHNFFRVPPRSFAVPGLSRARPAVPAPVLRPQPAAGKAQGARAVDEPSGREIEVCQLYLFSLFLQHKNDLQVLQRHRPPGRQAARLLHGLPQHRRRAGPPRLPGVPVHGRESRGPRSKSECFFRKENSDICEYCSIFLGSLVQKAQRPRPGALLAQGLLQLRKHPLPALQVERATAHGSKLCGHGEIIFLNRS